MNKAAIIRGCFLLAMAAGASAAEVIKLLPPDLKKGIVLLDIDKEDREFSIKGGLLCN